MKKQLSVEVSDSTYKVVEAVKNLVKSAKEATADGFQPGQDLPKVLGENFTSLLSAVSEARNIPAEAKEDMEAFLKAWLLGGAEIGALFLAKPATQPAPAETPAV